MRIVIEQATKYAADDGFFAKLAAGAKTADGPLPADLQDKLDAGAAAARSAYARLAELPANPSCSRPPRRRTPWAGSATPWRPASFLGAAVDLEETYAWGVQELDRLIAEQERVAGHIRPGATIDEAKEILNNDPARQLKGTDALQAPGCRISRTRPWPSSPACTSTSRTS